jgi:hypothetical protein
MYLTSHQLKLLGLDSVIAGLPCMTSDKRPSGGRG